MQFSLTIFNLSNSCYKILQSNVHQMLDIFICHIKYVIEFFKKGRKKAVQNTK